MRLGTVATALACLAIPTIASAHGGNNDPNVVHGDHRAPAGRFSAGMGLQDVRAPHGDILGGRSALNGNSRSSEGSRTSKYVVNLRETRNSVR